MKYLITFLLLVAFTGWDVQNYHNAQASEVQSPALEEGTSEVGQASDSGITSQEPMDVPQEVESALECTWCGDNAHLDYVYEVFGHEDAEKGLTMLTECENKDLGTTRINWNGDGTNDTGLWQINSIHGYTHEQLFDPYFNTDVAYKIFKAGGNTFYYWTCGNIVGDKTFWQGGD